MTKLNPKTASNQWLRKSRPKQFRSGNEAVSIFNPNTNSTWQPVRNKYFTGSNAVRRFAKESN